jgi:flagellar motor switch protein FliN/FliY
MSTFAENLKPKPLQLPAPKAKASETDRLDQMPWLRLTLSVDVPVARFTLRDLLGLTKGSIVETACNQMSDVPLRANNVLVGWAEFEVIDDRLAVRFTDPA